MKKPLIGLLLITLALFGLTACSSEDIEPIAAAEVVEIDANLPIIVEPANIVVGKVIEINENDLTIQLAENPMTGNNPNPPASGNNSPAEKPENAPEDARPEQMNSENSPRNSENSTMPEGDSEEAPPTGNDNRQLPNDANSAENLILTEQTTTYTFAEDLDLNNAEIAVDMYINIVLNEAGEAAQITILSNQ